jgi:hypothetical protein
MAFRLLSENTSIKYTALHKNQYQRQLPRLIGKCIAFVFFFALLIGYSVLIKKCTSSNRTNVDFSQTLEQNLLDGCQYVYIDLGTNIGVQIRKLYEPHLYPNSSVLPLFQEIFGNHSNEVCSVGFEANPVHDRYLKEFENYCLQRNWRVKIFTSTAVSINEGNVTFYRDRNDENQWGTNIDARSLRTTENITVPSVDIVSWFKTTVLNRKISPPNAPTRVMMKSGIEGHDSVVLANLILGGVYCSIDLIYAKHLDKNFNDTTLTLQGYSSSCKTKLINMNDEKYYLDCYGLFHSAMTSIL